jgi:hypothetical protein
MPKIESIPEVNVRSRAYYVVRTQFPCWHCGASTRVLALAVPYSHETLDDAESQIDVWQRADANALLFYIEGLPAGVQRRLDELSKSFRLGESAATLNAYWANHCEHCGALLDDHELHCEPGGTFMPSSEAAAGKIELLEIQEPFEAVAAGYAPEPEFLRFVRMG